MENENGKNKKNENFHKNLETFIRVKSGKVSMSTYTKFRVWKDTFLEYERSVPGFQWSEEKLKREHLIGYREFLKNIKHHNPNTVTKNIKCLKNFLKEMYPHVKVDYLHVPETPRKPISLSESELNDLQGIDFGKDSAVMDIFFGMCFTGMEYKDFCAFHWNHEVDLIAYHTHRRRNVAVLPMTEDIRNLVKKYNGKFPKFSEAHLNRTLKNIFATHGFDRLVTDQINCTVPGTPLYKKITLSVARHTFIQCKINEGVRVLDIMKMCGINNLEKLTLYEYQE